MKVLFRAISTEHMAERRTTRAVVEDAATE
jgi:hypothetical protein